METAVAHVAADQVDRRRVRFVVPIRVMREPQAHDGNAPARDRDVQWAGRDADEQVGARRKRLIEPRERLVDLTE